MNELTNAVSSRVIVSLFSAIGGKGRGGDPTHEGPITIYSCPLPYMPSLSGNYPRLGGGGRVRDRVDPDLSSLWGILGASTCLGHLESGFLGGDLRKGPGCGEGGRVKGKFRQAYGEGLEEGGYGQGDQGHGSPRVKVWA